MNEKSGSGLVIKRHFTKEGEDAYQGINFVKRESKIAEADGKVIFEMKDVEVPESWSQLAIDILASKYFRKTGVPGTGCEKSAKQTIHRIAHTISIEGEKRGYFKNKKSAEIFEAELKNLLMTQRGAFNSPVWFNLGLHHEYGIKGSGGNWYQDNSGIKETNNAYEQPQCSACFIQSVEDDLGAIFSLVAKEAKLFKFGSGTGTNFSKIRSRHEQLSGGGLSSGLLSFLEVFDKGAGATKSGGTTRRAAKMVTLDMDHPEILDFIDWKVKEEKKALALISTGYDSDFNGEAYHTVSGQNSNNSVRINDDFMKALDEDGDWSTTFRTTGEVYKTYKAKAMFRKLAEAAWSCADPGVQFDTTINSWHTCPEADKINGSNPCSEFMFVDDSACNLSSLNLMKFLNEDNTFDIEGFKAAARLLIISQEIIVSLSSYPTKEIAENSFKYRPLGLGYANLGTLLMVKGLPYDSMEGRALAASITALLTGQAYVTSAALAAAKGQFEGFDPNKKHMMRILKKHSKALDKVEVKDSNKELLEAARKDWNEALELGAQFGYRNAQVSLLAPTGTIGFLMDCDTTGVEPDFSLVKWKKLAGGGYLRIVNQSLTRSLLKLGYTDKQVADIICYILGTGSLRNDSAVGVDNLKKLGFKDVDIQKAIESVEATGQFNDFTPGVNPNLLLNKGVPEEEIIKGQLIVNGTGTIEGAPHCDEKHYPVFECANKCGNGSRFIQPLAHIRMMAAVQPFLSGAISKTVNVPNETTVEEIEEIYLESWKIGLKSVALYRDGSKGAQPLSNKDDKKKEKEETVEEVKPVKILKPVKEEKSCCEASAKGLEWGKRRKLPKKRAGFTQEATVGGHKLFLRTGEYEDGKLGEIFIDMYKEGASYRSMMNCFAIAVSIGLSYGVPLEKYVDSFTFTRFDPSGMTDHPNIRYSTSLLDYVFRLLGMEYLGRTDFVQNPPAEAGKKILDIVDISNGDMPKKKISTDQGTGTGAGMEDDLAGMMGDAPPCSECGHITVRNGSCYRCLSCGNSMGCS